MYEFNLDQMLLDLFEWKYNIDIDQDELEEVYNDIIENAEDFSYVISRLDDYYVHRSQKIADE